MSRNYRLRWNPAKGKFIVIDTGTGDYEIAQDDLTASNRAVARNLGAILYGIRIGYPAAYHMGAGEGGEHMPHTRYTAGQIVQRGQALYEQQIRPRVEAGNDGKLLVIDVETDDYELDTDDVAASYRLQARHPGAALYAMRVGSAAFGRIGRRQLA